jgi:CRISPR-associated protein Cst2
MTENKLENKFIQFCVICEIEGNVNADEVVGTRATIKKFITKEGIYPFVSSRAIKKGIRAALEENNFPVDPFHTVYGRGEEKQRGDSGDFVKFVDQDLFGFMLPTDPPKRRKAPVELSYLVSIFPIPTIVEFGGRFPKNENPIPFEIEQAKFIGKFYGNIYNYIGVVHSKEVKEGINFDNKWEKKEDKEVGVYYVDKNRLEKLKTLLKILLLGNFKLPRSTNQLNQGIYRYVVVAFVKSLKPLPAFVTVRYQKERAYEVQKREENGRTIERIVEKVDEGYKLDIEKLKEIKALFEQGEELYVIDFVGDLGTSINNEITVLKPNQVKKEIIEKVDRKINLEEFGYYLNFYKEE